MKHYSSRHFPSQCGTIFVPLTDTMILPETLSPCHREILENLKYTDLVSRLTKKEMTVYNLVVHEGLTNKQIISTLVISKQRLSKLVCNLRKKLTELL